MRIDIITVLPEMLESPLGCSILKPGTKVLWNLKSTISETIRQTATAK